MSKEYADINPPPYGGGSPYPPPPGHPHQPPGNPYPPQYMAGPGQPQGYATAPLPPHYYAWPATQAGYPQAMTVVVQPAVTVIQVFRDSPVHTTCNYCRAEIMTATSFEAGTFTWVICCVLWFVGCFLGCCLIPFCLDGCKDVIHSCPNCRQQIARFSRM